MQRGSYIRPIVTQKKLQKTARNPQKKTLKNPKNLLKTQKAAKKKPFKNPSTAISESLIEINCNSGYFTFASLLQI
jgi:hypothetical protein